MRYSRLEAGLKGKPKGYPPFGGSLNFDTDPYLDLPKSDLFCLFVGNCFSAKVIIFLPGGNFPEICFLDVFNNLAEACLPDTKAFFGDTKAFFAEPCSGQVSQRCYLKEKAF